MYSVSTLICLIWNKQLTHVHVCHDQVSSPGAHENSKGGMFMYGLFQSFFNHSQSNLKFCRCKNNCCYLSQVYDNAYYGILHERLLEINLSDYIFVFFIH